MNLRRMIGNIRKHFETVNFEIKNKKSSFGNNLIVQNSKYITIGNNCAFDENCRFLLWDNYEFNEKNFTPSLIIGDNVRVTRNFTVQCAKSIVIGSNSLIASGVFVIDYNHGFNPYNASYRNNPLSFASVNIGEGVFLGNDVIILPGVDIGEKSIIGAGSVVSKSIPSYSMAVGNPCHVIKKFNNKTGSWEKI